MATARFDMDCPVKYCDYSTGKIAGYKRCTGVVLSHVRDKHELPDMADRTKDHFMKCPIDSCDVRPVGKTRMQSLELVLTHVKTKHSHYLYPDEARNIAGIDKDVPKGPVQSGTGRLVRDVDKKDDDDVIMDFDKIDFMKETPESLDKRYKMLIEKEV